MYFPQKICRHKDIFLTSMQDNQDVWRSSVVKKKLTANKLLEGYKIQKVSERKMLSFVGKSSNFLMYMNFLSRKKNKGSQGLMNLQTKTSVVKYLT